MIDEPPILATPHLLKAKREIPAEVVSDMPPHPERKRKAPEKIRLSREDETTQSSTPEARKRATRDEIVKTEKGGL